MSLQILLCILAVSVSIGCCSRVSRLEMGSSSSYCESETFRAKCWTDHVILMHSAVYGRMRIGRCVEANLGHLGCQKDVLRIADDKCSALQGCEIRIPDADFDATKPCYKELKVYLEANYSCLRVLNEDHGCSVAATVSPSHISSLIMNRQDCGSESHPWVIQADPGQKVTVLLMDFSYLAEEPEVTPSSSCLLYGYVMESRGARNASICGGGRKRRNFTYESKSNTVEVVLVRRNPNFNAGKFIIQFRAIGCADLRPLRDAWISRTNDEVVVGCNSSSQTWHLKCHAHQWSGVIGNCTQRLLAAQTEARVGIPLNSFSSEILIVIVVAISLTLCILIIFAGFAYVRSWSEHRPVLNSVAVDYTSVVSSEKNCDQVAERNGFKRTSFAPSLLSFDYTEVLQPTIQPPGNRELDNALETSSGGNSAQDSDVQVSELQFKENKIEGLISRFSDKHLN